MDQREQRIRERAHQIWEEEGRPSGRDREHWERAAREIEAGTDSAQAQREQTGPDEIAGSVGPASGLQPGGTKPGGGASTAGSPKSRSRT